MSKFIAPASVSTLTVYFRFKRNLDSHYWNNVTEEWQAADSYATGAYDSTMKYYHLSITHADFVAVAGTWAAVSSTGVPLGAGHLKSGASVSFTVKEVEVTKGD